MLVALGSACTPRQRPFPAPADIPPVEIPPDDVPPPRPAKLPHLLESPPDLAAGRFALISDGTVLYRGPSPDSPSHVFRDDDTRTVAVLAELGEFVEVEIAWAWNSRGRHCLHAVDGALALRLYVRADELEPVVTRGFSHTFADGSGFSVAPGTPVELGDVGVGLGWATVPPESLEPDLVGKFYVPAIFDSGPGYGSRMRETVISELGRLDAQDLQVYMRGTIDGRDVALVGDRCVQVLGVVEGLLIGGGRPESVRESCRPYRIYDMGNGLMLTRGKLTWPDGQDAGVVVHEWATLQQPRLVDGRACFVPEIGCTRAEAFEFCVDQGLVEQIPDAGRW